MQNKIINFYVLKVVLIVLFVLVFSGQIIFATATESVEPAITTEESVMNEVSKGLLIKDFVLSVRPEFDFPEGWRDQEIPALLVIQIAQLENLTEEPITRLNWPAPVNDPYFFSYAVGKMRTDVEGRFFPAAHVLGDEEILIDLTEQPILPGEEYTLTVQYYHSPFQIADGNKTFDYSFIPPIDIEKARVEVVIPPAARNSRVTPVEYALQGGEIIEELKADVPIEMSVSYLKEDNVPTNRTQSQTGSDSESSMLVGFLALMLIIIVVLFLFIKANDKKNNASTKKDSLKKKQEKSDQTIVKKKSQQKVQDKPVNKQTTIKKANKVIAEKTVSEEKKNLRKQLVSGEIDEETYRKEIAKL